MRPTAWGLWVLLSAIPMAAIGASFPCRSAGTATEKLICSDAVLNGLDSQLQPAYAAALGAVAPSSKAALVKEQRNWIKYVRDVCQSRTCLVEAYKGRIALLRHNEKFLVNQASCEIPEGRSCRSVVRYRDSAARVDSFNRSLAARGRSGRVIGCSRLIDLPVGTVRGNHSFGGSCTLEDGGTRSRVLICNDDLLGHLAVKPEADPTESQLVAFTNARCFGG